MLNLIITKYINNNLTKKSAIYFGDWCKIIKGDIIHNKIDIELTKSFKEIDKNYIEIDKIACEIFPTFFEELNKYYKTDYSERFFQILLGNWFNYVVEIIYNRILLVQKLNNSGNKFNVITKVSDNYPLATSNSIEFFKAEESDYWNQLLFSKIIKISNPKNIILEEIYDNISSPFINDKKEKKISLKNIIVKLSIFFNRIFSRKNKFFFIETGFSRFDEFLLNLKFNQLVLWRDTLSYKNTVKIDHKLRSELTRKLKSKLAKNNNDEVFKIIFELLFKLLPICYLEGFTSLNRIVEESYLPANPKLIYTSTAYSTDDIFKLWTAKNVEKGAKYIIGQHGAVGWKKKSFVDRELLIADHFFSWGHSKFIKNSSATFCTKYDSKNVQIKRQKKVLLFIMAPYDTFQYRSFRSDILWRFNNEYDDYRKNTLKMINSFQEDLRKNIKVRLFKANDKYSWTDHIGSDIDFWKKRLDVNQIDYGEEKIFNLFNKSKLIVHTYDSTAILESLVHNMPTIIIFNNFMFEQLNEDSKIVFKKLLSVNILFLNMNDAIIFINKNWGNIDTWWNDKQTQEQIKIFCNKYAIKKENKINYFKKIILDKVASN